jgi:hypothetical protein
MSFLALALLSTAHAGPYAVIAIGPNGERGIGHNFPDYAAAERSALADCGDSACEVAVWVEGERCAAAATGRGNKIAWAYGRSADAAERAAMDTCNRYQAGCWTAGIVCNGRPVETGIKWASWASRPESASANVEVAKPEAAAAEPDSHGGGAAPKK